MFVMISLDGYFEGGNHDLSWHNTDEEFVSFAVEQLDETDTLLFGRKTYEMMADYWQTENALIEDHATAVRMNKLKKIVFSRNLFNTEWANTTVSTDLAVKIKELKSQPGKKVVVLGSSHLGKEMLETGLLDEVRIMVNPLFIGNGSTLFDGLHKNLKLTGTRTFKNGNVLLTYATK